MITAVDMYKAAVDARRAHLYGKIKSCALVGDFRTRVYKNSLDYTSNCVTSWK